MEGLRIEKFNPEELDEVLEVERDCFPKKPYDAAIFLLYSSLEPDGFFVAKLFDEIVGYIIASSKASEIVSIAVKQKYRKMGIGRALVKRAVDYLIAMNCREIKLHVRESNVGAIAFYEKCGFRKVEKVRCYYGDEDGYLMKLEKFFKEDRET